MIVAIARKAGFKTVLDYGCGNGLMKPKLAELMPELTVYEFDPAIPGKDVLPDISPDILASIDVMENIEPDYLTNVLETMAGLSPKCVVLLISTRPANKTLADGRNAHLIVQPAEWWLARLAPYFQLAQRMDGPDNFTFIGVPVASA